MNTNGSGNVFSTGSFMNQFITPSDKRRDKVNCNTIIFFILSAPLNTSIHETKFSDFPFTSYFLFFITLIGSLIFSVIFRVIEHTLIDAKKYSINTLSEHWKRK
jgi:hypothetical protein